MQFSTENYVSIKDYEYMMSDADITSQSMYCRTHLTDEHLMSPILQTLDEEEKSGKPDKGAQQQVEECDSKRNTVGSIGLGTILFGVTVPFFSLPVAVGVGLATLFRTSKALESITEETANLKVVRMNQKAKRIQKALETENNPDFINQLRKIKIAFVTRVNKFVKICDNSANRMTPVNYIVGRKYYDSRYPSVKRPSSLEDHNITKLIPSDYESIKPPEPEPKPKLKEQSSLKEPSCCSRLRNRFFYV